MEDQASSPITVQIQNSYSEPQTAWTDITLELKSTSNKGEFSLDRENWKEISTVIIPEDAQQVTFYYKDIKDGKPIITAKEYPDRGWEEASQQQKIVTEAKYFEVAATSPQVAGEYFTVQITAKDDEGEVNEYYSGEVEILANYVTPASGTLALTPDTASVFTKGVKELDIMYPDCGTIEILVRDAGEPSKTGLSGDIVFIPQSFVVSSSSPQVVSRPFKLEVSALNKLNQICPNYQGPTTLSVGAGLKPAPTDGAVSPATLIGSDFLNGGAQKNITYNRWGSIKIKAQDLSYPDKSGESEAISFLPSAILVEVESASAERDFFYVSESIPVDISVIDDAQEPIPNYSGTINISSSLGLDLVDSYEFAESDAGKHSFLTSADSAGIYQVAIEAEAGEITAEGPEIEVKEAAIEVISTTAPIGTAEVTVRLVDLEGNPISSENELTLTVELEEEYDDSSASSSTTQQPVTFRKGVAKVLVSNSQAERVTLSPSSSLKFKTRKGTVTFSRTAKSGIGSLLYREIKD